MKNTPRDRLNNHFAAMKQLYRLKRFDWAGPPDDIFGGLIFVHIPKTAGASIRSLGVKTSPGHKPYRYYEKWARKKGETFNSFSIVRDPYIRFVSAFNFLQRGGITALDKHWSSRVQLEKYNANSFAIQRLRDKDVLSWMHFIPQVDFVLSESGEVGVNEILHLESLADTWAPFAEKEGLQQNIPTLNKVGRSFPEELSSEARTAIQEAYKMDFSTFSYEV